MIDPQRDGITALCGVQIIEKLRKQLKAKAMCIETTFSPQAGHKKFKCLLIFRIKQNFVQVAIVRFAVCLLWV